MTVAALAILGPLAAAALILLFRRGASALALLGAGVALFGALVTLARVVGGARLSATLPYLPDLPFWLFANPLTAALSTVVAIVSALVLLYAVGYMGEEERLPAFFAGMSFFVAAMQALVLAGDWVLLLGAWELIGLASYLLIGFWFERPGAASAATRAFLTTRSADLGLYVGIFFLVAQAGTSEIGPTLEVGGLVAVAAGLSLLLAAAGKSAQTPLHGWLQDAMAGPTPVSALLHSATLVAAGAILLIRAFPLLPQEVLLVVGVLGGVTAVITSLVALAERDLKRLLAASTSSQYGLMLLALGAGFPGAAAAHLVAHAAMKSALFLGAGVFQHARGSTVFEDLAGAGRERRLVFVGFAVAGLALAGVPPLAGFFSKDAIIAASFGSPNAALLAPLALAGSVLTAVYIARALRLLWRGEAREEPATGAAWMGVGLAGLAALAATLGLALFPLARLLGEELPEGALSVVIGLVAALAGLSAGWLLPAERLLGPLRGLAARGFRIDGGFDALVVHPAFLVAHAVDALDRRVVHRDVVGVGRLALALGEASRLADEKGIDRLIAGLVTGARKLGGLARRLQTGLVHQELVLAVAGGALVFVLLAIGVLAI